MSGKHTQGPWIAAPYSSAVGAPVVAANGRSIAKITYYALASEGFANHERESDANGRLIAAAPDMLAALQAVMAEWRDGYGLNCVDQCRAAICAALKEPSDAE
jgi:uncharacterized protein (DUF1501 family)